MNTVVVIGYLSGKSCYLNISVEEARNRYLKENPDEACAPYVLNPEVIEFTDTFCVYDIWSND